MRYVVTKDAFLTLGRAPVLLNELLCSRFSAAAAELVLSATSHSSFFLLKVKVSINKEPMQGLKRTQRI